jgi:Fe2+ or Zn2+ uptake regulation protein
MSPSADVVEDALRCLRAAGGRVTSSRRAVLEALVTSEHHPDAESLAAAARRIDPNVHLATVYRTLDTLEQLGVITHVHFGHGRSTYHLAGDTHHHAVCNGCGMVLELDGGPLDELADAIRAVHGFEVDSHHFALVGRCATCADRR